jgi:hypothetical protein
MNRIFKMWIKFPMNLKIWWMRLKMSHLLTKTSYDILKGAVSASWINQKVDYAACGSRTGPVRVRQSERPYNIKQQRKKSRADVWRCGSLARSLALWLGTIIHPNYILFILAHTTLCVYTFGVIIQPPFMHTHTLHRWRIYLCIPVGQRVKRLERVNMPWRRRWGLLAQDVLRLHARLARLAAGKNRISPLPVIISACNEWEYSRRNWSRCSTFRRTQGATRFSSAGQKWRLMDARTARLTKWSEKKCPRAKNWFAYMRVEIWFRNKRKWSVKLNFWRDAKKNPRAFRQSKWLNLKS